MSAAALPTGPMTADAFIEWALLQEGRFELECGQVVAMAPERVVHARVKHRVAVALEAAIAKAGLGCEAFPDGMAVPVDGTTVYEPDALVRCGEKLPGDHVRIPDPVIVVEVLSPSTSSRDNSTKLADYFRVPSMRHYLILHPERRLVVHHARGAGEGEIATRILAGGTLALEPPGLVLDVAELFASV